MYIVVALFGILFFGQSLTVTVRYDNYRVYSVKVENVDHLNQLEAIGNQYDFWKSGNVGQHSDIMVAPHEIDEFEKLIENMNSSIKVNDVQRYICRAWNFFFNLNIFEHLSIRRSQKVN